MAILGQVLNLVLTGYHTKPIVNFMFDSIINSLFSINIFRNKPKHLSWVQYIALIFSLTLGSILYLLFGFLIGVYDTKIFTDLYFVLFLFIVSIFQYYIWDNKKLTKLNCIMFVISTIIVSSIIWLIN